VRLIDRCRGVGGCDAVAVRSGAVAVRLLCGADAVAVLCVADLLQWSQRRR